MFCLNCPIRNRCRAICQPLETELQRDESPLTGIATDPSQIEEIISNQEKILFLGACGSEPLHADEEQTEQKIDLGTLNKAMESLTFQQKEIIHFRFWEDLTPLKIAKKMGVSRQHVHRALRRALFIIRNEYLNQTVNGR